MGTHPHLGRVTDSEKVKSGHSLSENGDHLIGGYYGKIYLDYGSSSRFCNC